LVFIVLLVIAAGVSCVRLRDEEPAAIWTPAPITSASSTVTAEPTATEFIVPTATPRPVFTPRATATRADTVAPAATQDPKLVVITEADVMRAVESSVAGDSGASARDLRVRFTDGRMRIEAAALSYGPVNVENLVLVGRLVAQDGKLQLETESVSPRGLLAAVIPTFANQALEQYTARWYVEDVKTLEGRIEARIR
jgi:hypothetical protein